MSLLITRSWALKIWKRIIDDGGMVQVEMFVLCTPEQSEALLDELVELELALFGELGLHFKVLDMPTGDLGAPAYRKIDFEVR